MERAAVAQLVRQELAGGDIGIRVRDLQGRVSEGAEFLDELPAGRHGQVIRYASAAMLADGVVWTLMYDEGQATYPWLFVGGSDLEDEVATSESLAAGNNSYTDLATSGPAVALPLAGDYAVGVGALIRSTGVDGTFCRMSYAIGATAAVDADAVVGSRVAGGGGFSASRWRPKSALTAVTLTSKYKGGGSGQGIFEHRWMRARPVRVG